MNIKTLGNLLTTCTRRWGRESHARSHPLCSLSRACMYAKFVEQKKEKEKTSVVRLNKIWQCLFLTFLSKTVARE